MALLKRQSNKLHMFSQFNLSKRLGSDVIMSKIDIIAAILFLIIGIWQIGITFVYFKNLKKNANKNTSPFTLLAMWSSLVIGVTLAILGISAFL